MDATGLEAHHVSAHYSYRYSLRYQVAYAQLHAGRRPRRRHQRPTQPKLTIAAHTASHLILGAVPGVGPSNDAPSFAPVMAQAAALLAFRAVVADAGYDAEHVHVFCRQALGIRATAVRLNPRTARRWPRTRYRREMRRKFPWRLYHRRQQAESIFSQHKRRLGSALTARRAQHQAEEQILRVLTHNLQILHFAPSSFQQSR